MISYIPYSSCHTRDQINVLGGEMVDQFYYVVRDAFYRVKMNILIPKRSCHNKGMLCLMVSSVGASR